MSKKKTKEYTPLEFRWKWCSTCGCAFVECPVCKNNLCNGMAGEDEEGFKCIYCHLGYQYQDAVGHRPTLKDIKDCGGTLVLHK